MLLHALIEAGGVAVSEGIGGGHDSEHGMRLDDLAPVFRNDERTSFQDVVQARQLGRIGQVDLVEQKDLAVLHRLGERTVHEGHDGRFTGRGGGNDELPLQLRKLEPAVERDLLDGPVETRGHFRDDACLSGTRRAGNEERVAVRTLQKRDDASEHFLSKDVVVVSVGDCGIRLVGEAGEKHSGKVDSLLVVEDVEKDLVRRELAVDGLRGGHGDLR